MRRLIKIPLGALVELVDHLLTVLDLHSENLLRERIAALLHHLFRYYGSGTDIRDLQHRLWSRISWRNAAMSSSGFTVFAALFTAR
jgi:hypothetical protein